MTAVDDAISRSNRAILDMVWPRIGRLLGGGRLVVAQAEYDTDAGIDFIWLRGHVAQGGVAARVQWGQKSWDTFTIRTRTARGSHVTEWRKRHDTRQHDGMLPAYTLQAYLTETGSAVLSAAMCRSEALYGLAFDAPFTLQRRRNADGSAFVAVPWGAFDPGSIRVWRAPKASA